LAGFSNLSVLDIDFVVVYPLLEDATETVDLASLERITLLQKPDGKATGRVQVHHERHLGPVAGEGF